MTSLLALAVAVATLPPPSNCTLCHPEQRVAYAESVHQAEAVSCTACHGGDPDAIEAEAAHKGEYRGHPKRSAIPALCGECHSDPARMRAYNLPTDQLALYETSQHGRLLAEGNADVAVCTDCHGVHDIRRTIDPSSRVNVRNIPDTCGGCHGDVERMAAHDVAGDVVASYKAGVHGRALLEAGNASAPSCATCHGAHGAAPPGVGDVDKVCGQCHGATRAHFVASPHYPTMAEEGFGECAGCHGNHGIQSSDVTRIDDVCVDCHDADGPEVERAVKMKTLFEQAGIELDRAHETVEEAATIPLYVEDYVARLEEARTALYESLPVMHTLDVERVEELARRSRSVASEAESEVLEKMGELRWRRVGLGIFWFYLLLTVAILAHIKRSRRPEVEP